MSGKRSSRQTPSITNRPTCGGITKSGLAISNSFNSRGRTFYKCGSNNNCYPSLSCCPDLNSRNRCDDNLIFKHSNFVFDNRIKNRRLFFFN